MSGEEPVETKQKSKLLTVCPYILGNELCERLAFYGVFMNLVNYFKKLGASSSTAASSVSTLGGFCYLFPLLGGWIADTFWGRYRTILAFSISYLCGLSLLAASAAIPGIKVQDGHDANEAQWGILLFSLFVIAMSTGGIKSNVSSFGADQFDDNNEQDKKQKKSFFNWFYFFINVGAAISSIVIVKIQDEGHWDIGFAIPACVMFIAILFFVSGTSLYRFVEVKGSPVKRFVSVTKRALINRRKACKQPSSFVKRPHWLDWAIEDGYYTEREVYDIKLVYRPFFVFLTLVFSGVSLSVIIVTEILQAEQMERNIQVFGHHYKIPSASLGFFNTTSLLILIPIYDLILIPSMKKLLNFTVSHLQRIGTGLAVATGLLFGLFWLERVRLQFYRNGKFHLELNHEGEEIEVVELSIWWQAAFRPLSAVAEVFAAIGILEFFYSQAPDSMRSMMSSLALIAGAIGGYLSGFLLFLIDKITSSAGCKWIPNNLNHGHLDYLYLLLVGMMSVVFIGFVYLAKNYDYKEMDSLDDSDDTETKPILNMNLERSDSSQFPGNYTQDVKVFFPVLIFLVFIN